jgi:hypothetical protein
LGFAQQKSQFGNGKCWYILCPFVIFYGHWVDFPRFGMLHREKPGNPELNPASVCRMYIGTHKHEIIGRETVLKIETISIAQNLSETFLPEI